jgi:hypothetical protein
MVDLTGYWLADDGCQYYLSQKNAQVWWAGLDNHGWFHDGLETSNVFFGSIPQYVHLLGDPIRADTLVGDWFDVPRGLAMSSRPMSSGHVSLRITLDAAGEPATLVRQQASGGFKPTQWRKSNQAVGGASQLWFDKPIHDMDAEAFLQMAVRNSGDPLHDDLRQPFRNVVVLYGWVGVDDPVRGFESPRVSQHVDWGKALADFFDTDHDGDRDANFDLQLNIPAFHDHLQRSNVAWIAGRDPRTIERKLDWVRDHQGRGDTRIHCEMVMYGVTLEDTGYIRVYPGWADSQGNSVLVNGRPVNGGLNIGRPVPHYFDFGPPSGPVEVDDPVERYLLGFGRHPFTPGSYVRVTGVLVLDCGHSPNWPFDRQPCWEDPDDEGDMSHNNVEIHPVFAVDVINATPTVNLSGTWGAGNGDTIYLHQVGQTVAGLRLPPLGAGNGITVLHGIRQGDEIRGTWRRVSPPAAGGAWRAGVVNAIPRLSNLALSVTAPGDGWWDKLYDAVDQTPTMRIEQAAYRPDDVRHELEGREGGTVTFMVATANLPADTQLTYTWTVRGTNLSGTHEQSITLDSLPAAGTAITVSVVVEDESASQYEASHDFVVLPPLSPDERTWLELTRLLIALGKAAPPGPVPAPNLPDPVPIEVIELIRDLRAPTLTEIRDHLRGAQDLVRRLTRESESE